MQIMTNLETEITTNAQGPASVSGDAGSMTQHNLKDQIEADKYLAGKTAASAKTLGIRKAKMIPPGAA